MIELVMAMTVMLVALSIFSSTVISTARQRMVRREHSAAAEGGRAILERMRGVPFRELYASFNADPLDDPDGPGSAPGARFAVDELSAPEGNGGFVAEVQFPVRNVADPAREPVWVLSEEVVDRKLGMPRDLNGDGEIDALPHASDYLVLPVRIHLEWAGGDGHERSLDLYSTFARHRW